MKSEFGSRFINIGLEKSAVAAARVGGRPPRHKQQRPWTLQERLVTPVSHRVALRDLPMHQNGAQERSQEQSNSIVQLEY